MASEHDDDDKPQRFVADLSRLFPKRNDDGTPSYRPHQRETIAKAHKMLSENARAVIIDAPVGSGKSAINYTLAAAMGPAVYITSQKALQKQLDDENFANSRSLVGRNEYCCYFVSDHLKKEVSADGREFKANKSCRKCDDTDVDNTGGWPRINAMLDHAVEQSRHENDQLRQFYSGSSRPLQKAEILKNLEVAYDSKYGKGSLDSGPSNAPSYEGWIIKTVGCNMHGSLWCCPYKLAKLMLTQSKVRIMNPDGFYYQCLANPDFDSDVGIMIFDEAHGLDDAINRIMQAEIPYEALDKHYNLGLTWRLNGIKSPLKFREAWVEIWGELYDLISIEALARILKPLVYHLIDGNTINCTTQQDALMCSKFRDAMYCDGYRSVLDVLCDGVHMHGNEFAGWRSYVVETFRLVSSDGTEQPPKWFRDHNWKAISEIVKFVQKKHPTHDDAAILGILATLVLDIEDVMQPINTFVMLDAAEGVPIFVPDTVEGKPDYRGWGCLDGVNDELGEWTRLICVNPGVILRKYFYKSERKLVFSSGTWIEPVSDARMLALPAQTEVIQVPTTFPASRRPVYHIPCLDFSQKTDNGEYEYKTLAGRNRWIYTLDTLVDAIWAQHPKVNIVIHTNSFEILYMIAEHASISSSWMFHSNDLRRTVKNHRVNMFPNIMPKNDAVQMLADNHRTGLVLVSPSVKEGVDFKGDSCRAQIIVKAPIPNFGDPYVKAMCYGVPECQINRDHGWANRRVVRDLIQMYGRVMRSVDDAGLTFILDNRLAAIVQACWFDNTIRMGYFKEGAKVSEDTSSIAPRLRWEPWRPYTNRAR